MRRRERIAVVLRQIEKMWGVGSWCGETHVQKNIFFLQELLNVPLKYEFVIYKYGPFSFEFSYLIADIHGGGLIELVPQRGYRPKIRVTDRGHEFYHSFGQDMGIYEKEMDFVAREFGRRNVDDLERIATSYFITKNLKYSGECSRVRGRRLLELKPHISLTDAVNAVEEIDQIVKMIDEKEL